jgi:hypothetical protein
VSTPSPQQDCFLGIHITWQFRASATHVPHCTVYALVRPVLHSVTRLRGSFASLPTMGSITDSVPAADPLWPLNCDSAPNRRMLPSCRVSGMKAHGALYLRRCVKSFGHRHLPLLAEQLLVCIAQARSPTGQHSYVDAHTVCRLKLAGVKMEQHPESVSPARQRSC